MHPGRLLCGFFVNTLEANGGKSITGSGSIARCFDGVRRSTRQGESAREGYGSLPRGIDSLYDFGPSRSTRPKALV